MSAAMPSTPAVIATDPRTDPRWQTLAMRSEGSLFTSPPWIRAVSETYGFTPEARIVADAAGCPTDGFTWVPISDIRGDRLISLPFSDRAEPIVADLTTWSSLVEDALCSDAPIQIRCLDAALPRTDARLARAGEAAWHCTPLSDPISEIYNRFKPAARRNIAAADRAGVRVEASTRIDAVRSYHGLHVSLRKYKYGLLAQPLGLFEKIWQEFSRYDGVVTLLAHVDGDLIAGAVYLIWNDTLYYKFGASLAGTLGLRPNDALAWGALQWASERKLRMLDWGLSDFDQPGLVAYKRKWASEERRIVTLRSRNWSAIDRRGAGQLLGELTRLLTDDEVPDHITEGAGALLYRYFA
ncbi:GNAT family N-acetyltransferase [Mycolicibacterium moriokaense]|nr:GNAT family N-acetyltransferase [Mycolicibacterium moriokaense]